MVGDRAGVLPELFQARDQLFDAAGAVKQAVFGMQVQMCECHAAILSSYER